MSRFRYRIAAFAAATAAAFSMSAGVFAARGSTEDSLGVYLNEILPKRLNEKNTDTIAMIEEYICRTLPYCLSANELYGTYDFFTPIRLQNWDNDGEEFEKYWVTVSRNDTMTGYVMVSRMEDRLVSGFCAKTIPEIGEALSAGEEIQLGYRNGCLLLANEEGFTAVEYPNAADLSFAEQITFDREAAEAVEKIGTVYSQRGGSRKERSVSGIRTVSNARSARRKLLCWAACVACMGMQNRPQTDHSAGSVYTLCAAWEIYARFTRNPVCDCKRNFGEPHGCDPWILRSLALVGVSAKKDGALTSERICALLAENKPIMTVFYKTESTQSVGHTAVLYRYIEIDESSGLYVFMDPGMGSSNSGSVTAVIDCAVMENGENLILPSVTGTYVNWYRSFYWNEDER